MSIAIYAGTFDPITLGHLSVVRRAAAIFEHVRILVSVNPAKHPLFTGQERMDAIAAIVHRMPQVSVDSTEGLVVEYAREVGARFLVRGVRSATDAEFEMKLAQQNRALAPDIETVLLPADLALSEVSSSEVKRRVAAGESVASVCTPEIEQAIRQRLMLAKVPS